MKKGKYRGWDPMLLHGTKLAGKTLGILGSGKIGADVAHRGKYGFGMNIAYYDVKRNEGIEKEFGATFYSTVDEVLKVSDIVSIHVPLLPSTQHLINADRLKMMKKDSYLINTSRGPVVDENALVQALRDGTIRGAGLDVFEFEPKLAKGLNKLSNVVLTPHIASGTEEARLDMATMSANNIINTLEGNKPENLVY
jgi:lactate dehydrogenase-like 2-hydroxyacid dehydrogenase